LIKIYLVLMLNVFIVLHDVCEHVVHVVFGRPPFNRKTSKKGSLAGTEDVQRFIATVSGRMANPTYQDLGEGKCQDRNQGVGCGAAQKPGSTEKEEE
jgi:hypothetical protein